VGSRGHEAPDPLDVVVDLASRRVLKNGQPIFGLLRRPPLQRNYLELLAGVANHVVISFTGAPLGTLAGTALVNWKPKHGW